jgi:hypothetical protein
MSQPDTPVQDLSADGVLDPAVIERAHSAMLADRSLQFSLPGVDPPRPPPEWLLGALKALSAMGPVVQVLVWGVIALLAAMVLFFIVREFWGLRLGWTGKIRSASGVTDWRPDRVKARILLEDADRLAAEGRFEEAVHLLLLRGVADIAARRPQLIGPALTSQDIAALSALPEAARPGFKLMADIVERSYFGGRPVDEGSWRQARDAYETLIFSAVWS